MKERPILFSGAMVRAILDGRKTQTRRVVKPQPVKIIDGIPYRNVFEGDGLRSLRQIVGTKVHRSPYGHSGDRLWVRETWRWICPDDPDDAIYRADGHTASALPPGFKWNPSIFMPRWASRITLEVTGVRVERLQEICELDALAEGVDYLVGRSRLKNRGFFTAVGMYQELWDSINAKRAPWASNPWVWVVEFKRL